MAGNDAADYQTDMQTIRDYVQAVVEAQTKMAVAYTSALANVETTFQTASPADAKPDVVGAALKSGLKAVEKSTVGAVKESTGVDLGPVVDMLHAVSDEIDRAAKAAQNLAAGEWIETLRTQITNAYTQGQSGDALRQQIEGEYNQGDAGTRGGYIGGIENELDAVRGLHIPLAETIELAMYESWINQAFTGDCMGDTGVVVLQYSDDGTPGTAVVSAPLGDKLAGRLNNIMSAAGVVQLMNLGVVKRVCKGSVCMCFESNNVVRMATNDDTTGAFLSAPDTWKGFTLFTT